MQKLVGFHYNYFEWLDHVEINYARPIWSDAKLEVAFVHFENVTHNAVRGRLS